MVAADKITKTLQSITLLNCNMAYMLGVPESIYKSSHAHITLTVYLYFYRDGKICSPVWAGGIFFQVDFIAPFDVCVLPWNLKVRQNWPFLLIDIIWNKWISSKIFEFRGPAAVDIQEVSWIHHHYFFYMSILQ